MTPHVALAYGITGLLGVALVIAAVIVAGREHRRQP
jgi:hypothetical protein